MTASFARPLGLQYNSGDGGLVVRLRTLDQGVPGSNPAWTVRFFFHSLHPGVKMGTLIGQYVFVQACHSLSVVSRWMLLEKGEN